MLLALRKSTLRFNGLRRDIGDISQRVLTETLRDLERDGYITRTVQPDSPPSVSYDLTNRGVSILKPFQALVTWAKTHHDGIRESSADYDLAQRPETLEKCSGGSR